MFTQLVPAEASLVRATGLLRSASEAEINLGLETNLSQILVQDAARMLSWQAIALLPEGVEIPEPPQAGLAELLQRAEAELRSRPIGEYPAGTSRLIVDLCDVIAAARAGAWT